MIYNRVAWILKHKCLEWGRFNYINIQIHTYRQTTRTEICLFASSQCLRWPNSNLHTNITHAVLWGNIVSISLQPETNWLFSKLYLNCPTGFSKSRQDPITGCPCAFEKSPHFHNGLCALLLHRDHPCEKEKGTPITGPALCHHL